MVCEFKETVLEETLMLLCARRTELKKSWEETYRLNLYCGARHRARLQWLRVPAFFQYFYVNIQ